MWLFVVALVWFVFWIRGGWIAAVLGALGMMTLVQWGSAPGLTEMGWAAVLILPWIPAVIRTSLTKQVHA